jgi:hypothetical protein
MGPKKIKAKLSLNKRTISNLNHKEMSDIYAGTADGSCIETQCQGDINTGCIHSFPLSCIPGVCKPPPPKTI